MLEARLPDAERVRRRDPAHRDAATSARSTTRRSGCGLALRRLELKGVTSGPEVEALQRRGWRRCRSATMQETARLARAPGEPDAERGRERPTAARRRSFRSPRSSTCASRTPWACPRRRRYYAARALGVRGRRSARVEHRGRRVPGHLRHRHDGDDHEHPRHAARRARRVLPARVRAAGAVRERRAHRRQQPGRRAVDRVRRVRGRLLHLLRRGRRSTACSTPRRCRRPRTEPAASSGRR